MSGPGKVSWGFIRWLVSKAVSVVFESELSSFEGLVSFCRPTEGVLQTAWRRLCWEEVVLALC